jgi:benzoyl-CoA reductase/2-hydroxyglutaryl-CoA dehydratase subunit BcrC/BadD/HgdB
VGWGQICSIKRRFTYNLERVRVQETLQDAGVPVLLLEGDYTEEQAGQLKTRIEAFVETL